eukprot:TRINITY_DN715_c0_g4_i2.p1 TRINITY_DN715_c0_g4~~TRINITY_DN715_c0_g4_i2.p1  ORF type:complete len:420 (+),score=117.05 TRINITY_DN715_c0_g4_i2:1195-2454(+)
MPILPSEIAQWKIERLVIANLPEDYRHAKLEEITKNSILIENAVRLPVFGKQCRLYARRSRLIEEGDKFSDAGRAEEVPAVVPLAETPAAQKGEAEAKEEEVIAERGEIVKDDNAERELRKESTESLLCEKILSAINENYGDENILEQGSPSPIKKSKAEHQRLVAKLKYQLPDGWEKPYDKNSILEFPANEQKENNKQAQTWNRLGKKDKGPVRPVPLSNHEVKRKFREGQAHEGTKEVSEAEVRPKNYVLDDMIAKLKDYQHLLTNDDLKKLAELEGEINLETPLDFGIFLAELKNKFNERYRSGYLNGIGVTLPYKSRRHEMGGAIENDEWPVFFKKLERIAQRVKKKRRRIIAARKKRGKVLYPRKYIYKPPRRPDVSKCCITVVNNKLFVSVFMDRIGSASTIPEENEFSLPEI